MISGECIGRQYLMIHKSLSYDWDLFLVSLFNKDKSLEGIERDLLIYRIQLCYSWLDWWLNTREWNPRGDGIRPQP